MLKRYDVTIGGVETTLLLSDEDAKAQGLFARPAMTPVKRASKARTPANKARTPANK